MFEERHPQAILVAEEFSKANALAEWLTEKGFPVEVVRPSAAVAPETSKVDGDSRFRIVAAGRRSRGTASRTMTH